MFIKLLEHNGMDWIVKCHDSPNHSVFSTFMLLLSEFQISYLALRSQTLSRRRYPTPVRRWSVLGLLRSCRKCLLEGTDGYIFRVGSILSAHKASIRCNGSLVTSFQDPSAVKSKFSIS